jgi:hypothetical protein
LKKYDDSKKDLNKATNAGKKDEMSSATKIVKSSNSEAIAARNAYAAAQKETLKAQKALTDAKGAGDRAAKLEKAKKFKKKLKLVAKNIKSAAKLKTKTIKELNVAKLKKDKTKIASITKKLEEIEDKLKSLAQQELVAKAKYNKAMGIKFKPSKKKVSAASFILKKVALKLGIQFDKENKLMDQKSALLLSNKKEDEAKLEEVNVQLGELKKSIPQMDEEAALAREKVMILQGKEPTSPIVLTIQKKIRIKKREVLYGQLTIEEYKKALDEAELAFETNKAKPESKTHKKKFDEAKKVYGKSKAAFEANTKALVKLEIAKKKAEGVKGEYKKMKVIWAAAKKRVVVAQKREG